MILERSLAKYTAKELLDCGAISFRQCEIPIMIKRLMEHRLDNKIQQNMKLQEQIIAANKICTGDPWMRNQYKLGTLIAEFDKLIKLLDQLSAEVQQNLKDHGAVSAPVQPHSSDAGNLNKESK